MTFESFSGSASISTLLQRWLSFLIPSGFIGPIQTFQNDLICKVPFDMKDNIWPGSKDQDFFGQSSFHLPH